VEDVKGNTGDKGSLLITNLRLIWQAKSKQTVNLSIGLDLIVSVETEEEVSGLFGKQVSLLLRTRYQQNRYEFIFAVMA
jgi:Bardet-Biedl syndrome 5 protein